MAAPGTRTGEGNITLELIKLLDEKGERAEAAEWTDLLIHSQQFMVGTLAEWLEDSGR